MEIKVHDKTFKPYLSEKEILSRVFDLAKNIEREYKGNRPLFISILNGSFMFASDFLKVYSTECEIEFIKVKSYSGTESTGKIKELIGLENSIEGRDIIILEDIIDTGHTIKEVLKMLEAYNPSSVKICTLLLKPDALKEDIKIHYKGFEIPNNFILGYGLDYNGLGRNLNELYTIV